jgi:deoxyribonuclease V
MEIKAPHDWPSTPEQALTFQRACVARVALTGNNRPPRLIAAVDTAYGLNGRHVYASAIVMDFATLTEVEKTSAGRPVTFPYIPGLFYFREGPAMVDALSMLEHDADVIIVHGHGVAHPRMCGSASHIGLTFDKPAIGCARRLLAGAHVPVAAERGASQPIRIGRDEVGIAYRSKDNVKPIFISPGHRCDLPFALDVIVHSLRGFRLPEPQRVAHLYANKYRRYREKYRAADPPGANERSR